MTEEEIVKWIKNRVKTGQYSVKLHAIQRINERGILPGDVTHALVNCKLLENYPEDKRGHSCLVLGKTEDSRDLHIVCGLSEENLCIITIYEPAHEKWETPERRSKK